MAWTTRYCRADAAGGGDGTTNTNSGANGAWTPAEAATNLAAGMELWVVAAGGTIAFTSTNNWTFATAGTHSSPAAIRGCNATPNDLTLDDSDNAPAMPLVTFATGHLNISGTFILIQKLHITSARLGTAVAFSAEGCQLLACRVINTAANSAARAVQLTTASASYFRLRRCYCQVDVAAGAALELSTTPTMADVAENRIVGGQVGVLVAGSTAIRIIAGNLIQGYTTTGISVGADGRAEIRGNTIHGGTNGVLIAAASAGNGIVNLTSNLFSGTMTNGVNYAGSPSTMRVRCFGNQYAPTVTNKRVGIFEDQHWYDVTLADNPHIDSATNDFRIDPDSDAYATGYPQYIESLTYKMMGVAGAAQVAVTLVSVDQTTIDEIIAGTAAAILEDPANLLYTDASGKVRLTAEEHTGAGIEHCNVVDDLTNPPVFPSQMNANLVQLDGVALAPHAPGMIPADQRAESGITLSAFDATVESGGTTTSCILSATGLPAGFNPANPPRALKWLDGDAASETGLVVSWVAGTRTLTYTAIGTPPSNASHVRFGPPQQIDGLGSVASVIAPVSVGGGTITTVTDPVTAGTITDKTGYALAAAGLDQVVIETGINARQALAPILAATAGKSTHPSSTQILFAAGKTTAGGSPPTRVTATVDGTGERTDVTLSVPP